MLYTYKKQVLVVNKTWHYKGNILKFPLANAIHSYMNTYHVIKWKEHEQTVQKSGTSMQVNIEYFDIMNVKAINRSKSWGSHSGDDEDSHFWDVTPCWLVNSDHVTWQHIPEDRIFYQYRFYEFNEMQMKCISQEFYMNCIKEINIPFLLIIYAVFRCNFYFTKIIYNM